MGHKDLRRNLYKAVAVEMERRKQIQLLFRKKSVIYSAMEGQ